MSVQHPNKKSGAHIVGCVTAFAAWAFLYIFLYGWCLSTLWLWFVLPVFAVPALPITNAIGLSLFIAALNAPDVEGIEDVPPEELGQRMMTALLRPLMVVGFAWILTLFM